MWPFDLRGPDFLVFYLVLGAAILTTAYLLRHFGEPEDAPKINLSDPYLIAFLRGGKNETLRVVTMCLVDRGLLLASVSRIAAADGAFGRTGSELEQKVIKHFNPSSSAPSLFKMYEADAEMNGYEDELIRLGLLPDRELKQARKIRAWGAAAAVFGVGLAKIIVAESTGHHNIFFLVVLMVVFSIAALAISLSDRTRAGDRMIDDLRTLFGGMKQRSAAIHNGASPKEFALMAAVFGMATVPNGKTLFPKAYTASCGLACGSDSSSGGSSCGGGGGCGGCGGS